MANILFVTAHPYLPQMLGGMQRSCDKLARDFIRLGHHVAVLTALMPQG